VNSEKLITKPVLNSLPAVQFNELIQDVEKIIDTLKTRYKPHFSLQEFIDTDYSSLFKNRVNALTSKSNEYIYENLNKDKFLREFRDKIDYKLKINERMREIGKKHGLSDYNITLKSISLILEANSDKYVINLREGELFFDFELFFDEIMSIFKFAGSSELKLECFDFFHNIRNKFKVDSPYRSPKKLSPIAIFMFLKMKGFNITMKNLIKKMKLDKKEVRLYFKRSVQMYPEYLTKDRKMIVYNQIKSVKDTFQFPKEFVVTSGAILEKFWALLSNTTESVAAGTVCILTMIVMDIENYTISDICTSLGFTQSAVNYQIKKKIFERLHIPGFQTITSSKELIKELIMKNIDTQ